jgi:hypothetical protein
MNEMVCPFRYTHAHLVCEDFFEGKWSNSWVQHECLQNFKSSFFSWQVSNHLTETLATLSKSRTRRRISIGLVHLRARFCLWAWIFIRVKRMSSILLNNYLHMTSGDQRCFFRCFHDCLLYGVTWIEVRMYLVHTSLQPAVLSSCSRKARKLVITGDLTSTIQLRVWRVHIQQVSNDRYTESFPITTDGALPNQHYSRSSRRRTGVDSRIIGQFGEDDDPNNVYWLRREVRESRFISRRIWATKRSFSISKNSGYSHQDGQHWWWLQATFTHKLRLIIGKEYAMKPLYLDDQTSPFDREEDTLG